MIIISSFIAPFDRAKTNTVRITLCSLSSSLSLVSCEYFRLQCLVYFVAIVSYSFTRLLFGRRFCFLSKDLNVFPSLSITQLIFSCVFAALCMSSVHWTNFWTWCFYQYAQTWIEKYIQTCNRAVHNGKLVIGFVTLHCTARKNRIHRPGNVFPLLGYSLVN